MGNCVIKDLSNLVELINSTTREVLGISQEYISVDDILYYCDINKIDRYKTKLIPKKRRGEFRTVYAPQGKLYIILKALNEILNPIYRPEKYVAGFVRKRSIADAAYYHIGQQYILNIDLKDFFEHIKYEKIVCKLKEKPYGLTTSVARIIAVLTCVQSPNDNSLCLAQGSPIAPIISNIVFEDIDRYIYNYCCSRFVRYSRYADDLTFSCNQDVLYKSGSFIKNIKQIISDNGFYINNKKTRLRNRGQRQEVTGIVVNVKPNVSREYIKDIRNLLYIWEKYGFPDAYKAYYFFHRKKLPNPNISMPYIVNYLRGKIAFLGLIRGKSDHYYIKFSQKFQSLLKEKRPLSTFIRMKDLKEKLFESGINLLSYETSINQKGNVMKFLNAGKYGNVYFDSELLQRFIETNQDLAMEYFSDAMSTNVFLSTSGVKYYAKPKNNRPTLSQQAEEAIAKERKTRKNRSWKILNVRRLTSDEINSIQRMIVVPSEYGLSAKISYKNGAVKFIPIDINSSVYVSEELPLERIQIVTLKNNYYFKDIIQRIFLSALVFHIAQKVPEDKNKKKTDY